MTSQPKVSGKGPYISTVTSFVLIVLVVSGGIGVASIMQTGPRIGEVASNTVAGFLIHVVNETSGQPVSGIPVSAGPVSSPNDIFPTWAGPWTLDECMHEVPNGSAIWPNGTVVLPNGTTTTYNACPLKTYLTNGTGWVSIPNAAGNYYFFNVGGLVGSPEIYGFVQLSQGVETYVTINWQNEDCQWPSNVPLATGGSWCS